jgi:hypothetical protein
VHLQRNQHEGWWAMSANPEVRIWVHAGGTGQASTSAHHATQCFDPGDVLAITGTRTAWYLEVYTVAPGEEKTSARQRLQQLAGPRAVGRRNWDSQVARPKVSSSELDDCLLHTGCPPCMIRGPIGCQVRAL